MRAVVFTATGEHFSAGADLREFGTAPSLFAMRDARAGARDVWGLLQAVPAPMIVAMQGNSVGFGFELALHCDVRVAADDCIVALPEARVGMIPVGGATQTLPRIVGNSAALHAILTGARFPAAEALARGFVDEVVPRAELQARALGSPRARGAPAAAVRAAKRLAWSALDLPLPVGLAREADVRGKPRARLRAGRPEVEGLDTQLVVALAASIVVWGLCSARLQRFDVSAPMVFVALGLLCANPLGLVDVSSRSETLHSLAELTLALLLFSDAARVNLRVLARDVGGARAPAVPRAAAEHRRSAR